MKFGGICFFPSIMSSFGTFTGSVVFADNKEGSNNITLRTRFVLIEDGGALHIGAPKCRYRSHATITLVGRSDDASVSPVPGFGLKFVGVRPGGTLELHGTQRPSWTLLTRTVPATGLAAGIYAFQRNFSRGINLRVVDQDTGAVLGTERFDTHDSQNDSRKLTQMLRSLAHGRIVALAVGDSAAKNLLEETKRTIQELLGSHHVHELKYRYHTVPKTIKGKVSRSKSPKGPRVKKKTKRSHTYATV